jgi:transposase
MIFCGIDIGKNEHGFAIVTYGDNNLEKPIIVENNLEGFNKILKLIRKHENNNSKVVIGIESTGHYWKPVACFFEQQGYRVDVFNPIISAKREQQSVRGSKSDKSSAVAIAKVVRDDDYSTCHLGTEQTERLKSLLRQRDRIVEERKKAKIAIINYWDLTFPKIHKRLTSEQLSSVSGLNFIKKFAFAEEVGSAHLTSLKNILHRLTSVDVEELRSAAKKSTGLNTAALHDAVLSEVRMLEVFNAEIKNLEKMIKEQDDRETVLLKSLPGVGLVTASTFMAEIGDIKEFDQKDKSKPLCYRILAYAGAEPRIRQSGKYTGKIKMSKRGNKHLRTALFLAADNARKHSDYFKAIYDKQKNKGKHHYVALSHVMRKLVIIAFAILKSGEPFDEKKTNLELAIT